MIHLRAHHLICLQSFEGKGYSDAFVLNMSNILDVLLRNSTQKIIKIVDKCDSLCEYCPNRILSHCKDEDDIKDKDNFYLNLLGIQVNNVLSYEEAITLINTSATLNEFGKICSNCCWFDICRSRFFKNFE